MREKRFKSPPAQLLDIRNEELKFNPVTPVAVYKPHLVRMISL